MMMNVEEEMMIDPDKVVDQLIRQYDETSMPLPDLEHEPHLLISKVRKHYMDYLVKLLANNYETNQKLVNKNVYLPSAIWRCAKNLETSAAQACMVVQLYRQNIVDVIKELKNDTKKGKLNRKLYNSLRTQPVNEKKLQTSLSLEAGCNCECHCKLRKKRRKPSESPKKLDCETLPPPQQTTISEMKPANFPINQIPVLVNCQIEPTHQTIAPKETNNSQNITQTYPSHPPTRMSVESQESDELMLQLEKLFQHDPNDDDLFDSTLCDTMDSIMHDEPTKKPPMDIELPETCSHVERIDNSMTEIENHTIQIKSLDERLASLAGLLTGSNNNENNVSQAIADSTKTKRKSSSKWLCEEYFLKSNFFEYLDEVGESSRKRLSRIKEVLYELFGDDSDDEGVLSPLEETPDFVVSCKERIAPWVVKLLTPYYIKGRIKGKSLFKSLAKHLIRLIYRCSKYPSEYEVHSFVTDFLDNHKMIRSEADFLQFKIDNF